MKHLCLLLFTVSTLFSSHTVFSQNLLKAVNSSNGDTEFADNFYKSSEQIGNNFYFTKRSQTYYNDWELWKTDGTTGGTILLKSFSYGFVSGLKNVNGQLRFTFGSYYYHSSELWTSDGTVVGTTYITTIPQALAGVEVINNLYFFWVNQTPSNDIELWRSDGTASGTFKLVTVDNSYYASGTVAVLANTLYFIAKSPATGRELWKTDGSVAGTQLVKDINPGANESAIDEMVVANNYIIFRANTSTEGYEIWRTDGTIIGTQLIKDIYTGSGGSFPRTLKVINDKVVFFASDNIDYRVKMWITDGTTNNTQLLKDIALSYPNSYGYIASSSYQANVLGNEVFFWVYGGDGLDLWKSNGTDIGTVKVKTMISLGITQPQTPSMFCSANRIYFQYSSTNSELNLWQSDGTTDGTFLVSNLNPSTYFSYGIPLSDNKNTNAIFFQAYSPNVGIELWKTDGTNVGLGLVKDLTTGKITTSEPNKFVGMNEKVYFVASESEHGTELWQTEGTTNSTKIAANFTENSGIAIGSSTIGFVIPFQNKLYVQVNEGAIYKSDGLTPFQFHYNTGTYSNTSGLSTTAPALVVNNNLFFTAKLDYQDGYYYGFGYELWKTDGNSTNVVKNINPIPNADSNPSQFLEFDNMLYFVAVDGTHGRQLWKSDGTFNGTNMVKELFPGYTNIFYSSFTKFNNKLYFFCNSKLFYTDGTANGTDFIFDIPASPQELVVANNLIFFQGVTGPEGSELWASNGQLNGTYLVKDIAAGSNSSAPRHLTEFGGQLYFSTNHPFGSIPGGFWKTDGTQAGTIQIKVNFDILEIIKADNVLYLRAKNSNETRYTLWKSDGTPEGTMQLPNVYVSDNYSNELYYYQDKLYFKGINEVFSGNPYVLKNCKIAQNLTNFNNLTSGSGIKYEVSDSINAINSVANGARAKYDAGKFILLNPGFKAEQGSIFKAYIDGCADDDN